MRRRTPRGRSVPTPDFGTALDRLRRGAAEILDRRLTENETNRLIKYLNLLTKWNQRHRFIGSSAPDWIVENLLLDSLLFLRVLPIGVRNLVDIGSGAGVPGVPIKIVKPDLVPVLLVESRLRRASFLSTVVRELDLAGVVVLADRIDAAPPTWRKALDAAVARCAGPIAKVAALAEDFVRDGGTVVVSGAPRPGSTGEGQDIVVTGPFMRTRRFVVFGPSPGRDTG